MRETVDNAGAVDNWLQRLEGWLEGLDGDYAKDVPAVADSVGGVFPVKYLPSGFLAGQQFVSPVYETGRYVGQPKDRYIIRADDHEVHGSAVLGTHSGKYPERDGYKHVYETLENLFPESCTGVHVFGAGERVVVEQQLDEPLDLGDGDTIQPFIYTRMSLNGVWKTEIIPMQKRLACENMLGHTGQLVSVRATKNHDDHLTMRSAVLETSMEQARKLANIARVLKDQEFTDMQFYQMVQQIVPVLEEDAPPRAITNRNKKVAAIGSTWAGEKETWANTNGYGNRWLAYNAVQGAEQHLINSGYKTTQDAYDKSYAAALDGKTPLASKALAYLV